MGEYFSDVERNGPFDVGYRYQLPHACACAIGHKAKPGIKSVHYFYRRHSLGITFRKHFTGLSGATPRPVPANQAAMVAFTDKTVSFFMQQVRAAVGNIPVLFALGNADSYTGLGPDATFPRNNAAAILHAIPERRRGSADISQYLHEWRVLYRGACRNEPDGDQPQHFRVFSPCQYLPDESTAVGAQLAWLDSTLASAQAGNKNVWLMMHVPPGAAITATAANVNGNGQITTAGTTMMWNQDYQATFLQILSKYPGLISPYAWRTYSHGRIPHHVPGT